MKPLRQSPALKILLSCLVFFAVSVLSAQDKKAPPLTLNAPLEKEIGPGEVHVYEVTLKKKQFFFAVLNQQGIDLKITALDGKGEKIEEFDSPNGANGPEPVTIISKAAGNYRLEVEPLDEEQPAGKYSLRVEKIEPAAKKPGGKVDQLFAFWDREGVPGASVAVVQNGAVAYARGYGSANLEYGIPNTPTTVFHIASVSKQFTAFAIAKLADEGKLSLDDDIRKYLPELPEFDQTITIRHLIHHTSGLRDQWNLLAMAGWRLDDVITEEQIMKLICNQKELNFNPGDEFLYCNTGYTLMAKIVENVSGQPFPEWTRQHIFEPLGMPHTLFYDDHQKIVPNRAYSYHQDSTGYKKSVLSYANVGATSLFTTVLDLSKWALNFEQVKVGNEGLMNQMHERGILNSGDTISYAFGQGIGDYKGLSMVSHGGADAGYRTFLARFPDQQFSVIVFSNLASFNTAGMAFKIVDIYLEEFLEEGTEEPKAVAMEKEEGITVSAEVLDDYAGQYELFPGFIITITREEDHLVGQATGQPRVDLQARSETEFFIPEANATIIFHRDDEEKVHQLVLFQGGQEMTAPRLKDFDAKSVNLTEYAGEFHSEELGTSYSFLVEKGKLIARHQRHPDIRLSPTKEDFFSGNVWFYGQVEFVRNSEKAITGVKVSNGRVRNLWFEKVN
jgi:CubicO group peptidase (beta-lactamase class C family)